MTYQPGLFQTTNYDKLMKRTLLFVAALFCAMVVSAQNYDYRLDYIESTDGLNFIDYHYGEDGRLLWYSVVSPDDWDRLELIDSLTYDQRGNIIKSNVYQKIDGSWRNVFYIEYTYDENNNRISRSNYNNFGGEFEVQGIYTYNYDENNRLVYHEMVLVDELFERANYYYDDKGYITEEIVEMHFFGDIWDNSSRVTYEYDANYNLTRINYFYWLYGNWALKEKVEYIYDAAGNCQTQLFYSGSLLASRLIYTYDMETGIQQVSMPYHIEPLYSEFAPFKNRPLMYSCELADDNWNLVYVCDYLFQYEEGNITSAGNVPFMADVQVFPNPASEQITVCLPGLKTVEILDMRGACIRQMEAGSGIVSISTNDLPSGVYFVRAFDGIRMQTTKMVVK